MIARFAFCFKTVIPS